MAQSTLLQTYFRRFFQPALLAWIVILNGCGGGESAEEPTGPDDPVVPETHSVVISAATGPFISAVRVSLFDDSGNALATQSHDFSSGPAALTVVNGYQGPVLVQLQDINGFMADYIDETSGRRTSLDGVLRAIAAIANSESTTIAVTPVTELAVRTAGIETLPSEQKPLRAQLPGTNRLWGQLLGIDDILLTPTTILDANYDTTDGIDSAETYGHVLAMLSGADGECGSIEATLTQIFAEVTLDKSGNLTVSENGRKLLKKGLYNLSQTYAELAKVIEAEISRSIPELPNTSIDDDNNRTQNTRYGPDVSGYGCHERAFVIFTDAVFDSSDAKVSERTKAINNDIKSVSQNSGVIRLLPNANGQNRIRLAEMVLASNTRIEIHPDLNQYPNRLVI